MAKRKAAGSTRKASRKSSKASARPKANARKAAKPARKAARPARKAARKSSASAGARKASAKTARTKATKKAAAVRRPIRRAATTPSRGVKRTAPKGKAAKAKKTAARKAPLATPRSAPPARAKGAVAEAQARKAPSLDRQRRTIADEDEEMVPMPPSSLDLDRSASAIRSGRRLVQQRFHEHNETSPAMTAGDVDADWESAYSVGDEAPGGDNPTPDQDIVDDIGRAVGVQYDDNEELKGADKVAKRDAHRWELDPASSEDWDDRD